MILAWTRNSKKDTRVAVQAWETEQSASFLPVSGLQLICLLLQCLFLPKEVSSPSLPDGNWFNCFLNHLLSLTLQHIKSSDQQSLAWDSQGKSHTLLLKGLPKVNGKNRSTICMLTPTAVGSTLPLGFLFTGSFFRSRIKGWKLLTKMDNFNSHKWLKCD